MLNSKTQGEKDMENVGLINAEYHPSIPRSEILNKSKYRFSLGDLSGLGSGFSVTAAAIAEAAKEAAPGEGLYRCVFPEGVTGELAAFKDGSGLLGTIMNEEGIVGQARWIPAEGKSIALAINPVTLAIAVAMMNINHKLDTIQETQTEILRFLHQNKESEVEGSVNSLSDILGQYRFNSNNELWKSGKLTVVTTVKGKAESNIIFYRKNIAAAMDKQKVIHSYRDADKIKASLEKSFKYYQLSVYISAYASFLEVILSGNYTRDYLEHMAAKIRDYSYQYRVDYTKCYEQLEDYMKRSFQAVALNRIGKAGAAAGKAISKVPVLNKGPVDEALIAAGKKIKDAGEGHSKSAMSEFSNNRDAGIHMFASNIDIINELGNRSCEVLFDKEEVYICA